MTTAARGPRDLIGDVQRFGLFSADTVVHRYTGLVDRVLTGNRAVPSGPPRQATEALLGLLESAAALLGVIGGADAGTETLVLPPALPGGTAELSLWVHNGTPSVVPAVSVRGTDLVSAEGRTIPAAAVSLTPDHADLAASGAQEVRLAVRVPEGQPPDRYLGLLLLSASPTRPMVLHLEVRG